MKESLQTIALGYIVSIITILIGIFYIKVYSGYNQELLGIDLLLLAICFLIYTTMELVYSKVKENTLLWHIASNILCKGGRFDEEDETLIEKVESDIIDSDINADGV